MCVTFNHPEFEDVCLYCVVRYASVQTEGESEGFFDEEARAIVCDEVLPGEEVDGDNEEEVEVECQLPKVSGELAEDIA